MNKIKAFIIDFLSAVAAMAWLGGMFLSITKQLSENKILEILPIALISSAIYAGVQLMGRTMITNKTVQHFIFLIPALTLLSLGFMPSEKGNLNFFVCGAGLLLVGYGSFLKHKKQAQIQQANGN
jgi:hypothetical protein